MENLTITLELTVKETNAVLGSLGKHPFDEIAALINKIQTQGTTQITEYQASQADAPEDTESDAG